MILVWFFLEKGNRELEKNVFDKDLYVLISWYNIIYFGWYILFLEK